MPRNIAKVSLFHLDPTEVADLLISDCFRMAIAHAPYKDGILVQVVRGRALQNRGGPIEAVVTLLTGASTHVWFHPGGAVLDLPTYDRDDVLAEYRSQSHPKNIDDSAFAGAGWQAFFEEHPDCNNSPMFFEKTAEWQAMILRERLGDLSVDWSLEEILEDVYNLACSIECVKLQGEGPWKTCDFAVLKLAETLSRLVDAFGDQYEPRLLGFENVLLSSLSRILRSLRVSGEQPRRPHHFIRG
jgi:hypothetical protein